jgi:hypothetical protein
MNRSKKAQAAAAAEKEKAQVTADHGDGGAPMVPGTLKMFVPRCRQLHNAELLGTSDPFVKFVDLNNHVIFSTPPVAANLNPTWSKDVASTEMRFLRLQGSIKVQVWDTNTSTDDFMGEVVLSVADAIGYQGEVHFPLAPRENEADDEIIKFASTLGKITIVFDYIPEPLTPDGPPPVLRVGSMPGHLVVSFTGCTALQNRETHGVSDPYVQMIDVQGSTAFKTPRVKKSLDPTWGKDAATHKIRIRNNMLLGAASGAHDFTLQVWDDNVLSDDLMGQVTVTIEDAMMYAMATVATGREEEKCLTLRPREREKDAFLVEHADELGSVNMVFSYEPDVVHVDLPAPPGTMTITVDSGTGLVNRDRLGYSDPFVRFIGVDGETFYESSAMPSTLAPIWPSDAASSMLRIYDGHGVVRLQVWDKNPVTDAFMGEAQLTVAEMMQHATHGEVTLDLRARSKEKDKAILSQRSGMGHLAVQFRFEADPAHLIGMVKPANAGPEPPGEMNMAVVGCAGLRNRDILGVSDPYVKVLGPDARVLYKTPTVSSNLEPEWDPETCSAPVRLAHSRGLLRFQVWDENNLRSDRLLGEHVMTVADALCYATGKQECVFGLRPREREEESALADHADELGIIRLVFSFKADQTPVPKAFFEDPTGTVIVNINSCANLVNYEATGTSDPYVKVLDLDGRQILKTKTIENTLHPTFTRGPRTLVEVPIGANTGEITLQVWDRNAFADAFMGEVKLPIADALAYSTNGPSAKTIMPLKPRLHEVSKKVKLSAHCLGTMDLEVQYEKNVKKLSPAEWERRRLFDILVPLKYVINHIEHATEAELLFRELMVYIPFIVAFMFFALARRDTLEEHYIAGGFQQQFTDNALIPTLFHDGAVPRRTNHLMGWWEVGTVERFHDWFEGLVVPAFWDWRNPHEDSDRFGPAGANKAIGAVRIRTLQMRSDSCQANTAFYPKLPNSNYNDACFADYNDLGSDKQTLYGPAGSNFSVPYVEGCDFKLMTIQGELARYPCGGYIVDFPLFASFNATLTKARYLREMGFFNETATRFLLIEWFTSNNALAMVTSSKYFVEVTNAGGWIRTAQIRSFKIFSDTVPWSFFFLYDVFFALFVLYYWVKVFADFVRFYRRTGLRIAYFTQFWTLLELLNLGIFCGTLGLHFSWQAASIDFLAVRDSIDPDLHSERLNYVMNLYFLEVFGNSGNAILLYFKILKFLSMNNKLNILTRTMARAMDNILGVLAIFFLITAAFALAGVQLYGNYLFEYRDFSSAFSSLFRALMGQFDYEELRVKNRAVTFIYFWSFIVLGLFIMLNFVTAIIGSAYQEEQSSQKTLPLAIAIRRTLRQIAAFNVREAARAAVNAFLLRTRRLRSDLLFEYISMYRLGLLQRAGVTEYAIRRRTADEPEFFVTRATFDKIIPRADRGEVISQQYLDDMYLEIVEDYDLLDRDQSKEEEELHGAMEAAITEAFGSILVTRDTEKITRCQSTVLVGPEKAKALRSAKEMSAPTGAAAHDLSGSMANANASTLPRGTIAEASQAQQATQSPQQTDRLAGATFETAEQDADEADGAEVLFHPETAADAIMAALPADADEYLALQRQRVLEHYLQSHVGNTAETHGLMGVSLQAFVLEQSVRQLLDVVTLRSHVLCDEFDLDEELVSSPAAAPAAA